jgi:hypothetical protein
MVIGGVVLAALVVREITALQDSWPHIDLDAALHE